MAKLESCESCPFKNFPLNDTATWEGIAEAQRRDTPEYSDATNAHLTDLEKQMRAGMEAYMDECPGYSRWKALGNMMMDGFAGSGKIVDTGKGTTIVKWSERVCNNPFLQTEEYAELTREFTRQSADAYEASLSPEEV